MEIVSLRKKFRIFSEIFISKNFEIFFFRPDYPERICYANSRLGLMVRQTALSRPKTRNKILIYFSRFFGRGSRRLVCPRFGLVRLAHCDHFYGQKRLFLKNLKSDHSLDFLLLPALIMFFSKFKD